MGQRGQRPEILRVLSEHDTSGPFGEGDDDRVDGGATAGSGPQSGGAASDELVDCFYIAHPEQPLLEEVLAGIAPESLGEDDRRDEGGATGRHLEAGGAALARGWTARPAG